MTTKALPLLILVLLALVALVVPEAPPAAADVPADTGDTAWLLTATCLVLLMTPGLSFF
jgi:Amt family ammonium transporter